MTLPTSEDRGLAALSGVVLDATGTKQSSTTTAGIMFPATALENILRIDQSIQSLNGDIVSQTKSTAVLDGWKEFKTRWDKFFKDHQPLASRMFDANGVFLESERYRVELESWRQALLREGGKPTADAPSLTKIPSLFGTPTPPKAPQFPWLHVLLAIGATGLAVMLFKKFSGKGSSTAPQLAAAHSPASEDEKADDHDHDFDD